MSLFIRLCSLFRGTQTAVLPPVQNFSCLSLALLHVAQVHTVLCTEYPRHDASSSEVSRRHRREHEQELEGWERRQVGERGIAQREGDSCTEMDRFAWLSQSQETAGSFHAPARSYSYLQFEQHSPFICMGIQRQPGNHTNTDRRNNTNISTINQNLFFHYSPTPTN